MEKPPIVLEDNSCQADFEELKSDGEASDVEDAYEYGLGPKPNTMNCGIQTSKIHFRKITDTAAFQEAAQDKAFSTDFYYSSMFTALQQQEPHQLDTETGDCDYGNQVEEREI